MVCWYEFNWWCNLSGGPDQKFKIKNQSKNQFPRGTKRRIQETEIKNGYITQIVHLLREKRDGKFIFKGKFLSILPNPVEISHKWVLKYLRYQEPYFYFRFFDESEKGSFEVPPGYINKYEKTQHLMLLSCMFCRKIMVIVCSVHFHLDFTSLVIKLMLIILNMKLYPR